MPDEKEDWKALLIKNTPLAVVILGVCLVLLAATGGIAKYSLTIPSTVAKFFIGSVGTIVALFGGILVWKENSSAKTPAEIAAMYDFRITNPRDGVNVDSIIEMTGTWKKHSERPYVVVIEQSPNSRKYWFKDMVHLDNEIWNCSCKIGGDPDTNRILHIAVVGVSGRALEEYYRQAGQENNKWPGIKTLTSDIVLCSSIQVHKKPKPSQAGILRT